MADEADGILGVADAECHVALEVGSETYCFTRGPMP